MQLRATAGILRHQLKQSGTGLAELALAALRAEHQQVVVDVATLRSCLRLGATLWSCAGEVAQQAHSVAPTVCNTCLLADDRVVVSRASSQTNSEYRPHAASPQNTTSTPTEPRATKTNQPTADLQLSLLARYARDTGTVLRHVTGAGAAEDPALAESPPSTRRQSVDPARSGRSLISGREKVLRCTGASVVPKKPKSRALGWMSCSTRSSRDKTLVHLRPLLPDRHTRLG